MVIFVAGLPGVGKSTIARGISKKLGIPYFDVDAVKKIFLDDNLFLKERLNEGLPLPATARKKVFNQAAQKIKRLSRTNTHLVVAETLHNDFRNVLFEAAKKHFDSYIVVQITAPDSLAIERLEKRKGEHVLSQLISVSEFYYRFKKEFVPFGSQVFLVSNTGSIDAVLSKISRKIKAMLQNNVMVFGVFDLLHPGHLSFLKQAKKLGSQLTVSVARDDNVLKTKGHLPVLPESDRLKALSRLEFVDKAVLGGIKSPWPHIIKENPNIIALGYDQKPYLATTISSLEKKLLECGVRAEIVRLKSAKPAVYKTDKLRKFSGKVRRHKGRGSKLGFPTANLAVPAHLPEGIYAAFVIRDKKSARSKEKLPCLVFIGAAKTFNEKKRQAEVYILDFAEELYGQRIRVELLRKIRDNQRFKSSTALVAAMKKDEQTARRFFTQLANP